MMARYIPEMIVIHSNTKCWSATKKNAKPAFQFFATMVGGMLMHRSARQHGLLLAGAAVFAGRSWASFRRFFNRKVLHAA